MLINKISRSLSENFGSDASNNNNVAVSFLNPYSYLLLRNIPDVYTNIDFFFCDGILLAKLMSITGAKYDRISFDMTSLAPVVFETAEKKGSSVYIIGAKPSIVECAVDIIKVKYPGLNVIGMQHGFFSTSEDRDKAIDMISQLNPDIVIAGMGTPTQEKFLVDLKKTGWQGIAYTCGGFLHQTAKNGVDYYPRWIDSLNLRWIYRIYSEPKLMKRYFFYYPLSILLLIKDMFVMKKI